MNDSSLPRFTLGSLELVNIGEHARRVKPLGLADGMHDAMAARVRPAGVR